MNRGGWGRIITSFVWNGLLLASWVFTFFVGFIYSPSWCFNLDHGVQKTFNCFQKIKKVVINVDGFWWIWKIQSGWKIGRIWNFYFKLLILFDANVTGFIVFCILYKWSLRVIFSFSARVKKALHKKVLDSAKAKWRR